MRSRFLPVIAEKKEREIVFKIEATSALSCSRSLNKCQASCLLIQAQNFQLDYNLVNVRVETKE